MNALLKLKITSFKMARETNNKPPREHRLARNSRETVNSAGDAVYGISSRRFVVGEIIKDAYRFQHVLVISNKGNSGRPCCYQGPLQPITVIIAHLLVMRSLRTPRNVKPYEWRFFQAAPLKSFYAGFTNPSTSALIQFSRFWPCIESA